MVFSVKRAAAAMGLCIIAGVGAATAKDVEIPVDEYFHEGNIAIDSGIGRAYEFLIDLKVIEGQLAVCGVGKFLDPGTMQFARSMMRKGKVSLNGGVILKDLNFFTTRKKNDDLRRAQAICRLTGIAPPKGDKNDVSIDLGFGVYRY